MLFPQANSIATLSCTNFPQHLYAIPKWGSTYNSYLYKASTLLSKTFKIVTHTKWDSSASLSYTNVKVLILSKLLQVRSIAKLIHNSYHKQHSFNLNQYFTKSMVKHSRPTCNFTSLVFIIPFMKKSTLQVSFL